MYTDSGDQQPPAWTLLTADGPHLSVDAPTVAGGLLLLIDAAPSDPLAPCAAAELTPAEAGRLGAHLTAWANAQLTPPRKEVNTP